MKNLKIKIVALIIGSACLLASCDKGSCEKDEHKSHHGEGHHKGDRKGFFGHGFDFRSMNPDSMAKHRTEMMKKELDLTTEQVPKVEQLNLKYATKMKEMREQMKQMEEERKKELATILTPEQLEKMEHKKDHHRDASADSTQEDN